MVRVQSPLPAWVLASVSMAVSVPAWASYSPECRLLASQLASEPGLLKLGELDVLKSCLSTLQKGITAGDPPPAGSPPDCPPPPPPRVCPVCPPVPVCETVDAAAEDPVRQRFIPRY